jgi:hypothetical protein
MSDSTFDLRPAPVITGPNQILASTPSRPPHAPREDNPIYRQRKESGAYDSVADQIKNMGSEALANLDYPKDITRHIENWSGNHQFMGKDGNELQVSIVGEILGPAQGTIMRAHGNYYARNDSVRSFDSQFFRVSLTFVCFSCF